MAGPTIRPLWTLLALSLFACCATPKHGAQPLVASKTSVPTNSLSPASTRSDHPHSKKNLSSPKSPSSPDDASGAKTQPNQNDSVTPPPSWPGVVPASVRRLVLAIKCPNGTAKVEWRRSNHARAWCVDKSALGLPEVQQRRNRHGPALWLYSSGQTMKRLQFRRGQVVGLMEEWFATGKRKLRAKLPGATGAGKWEEWYPDGGRKLVRTYKSGRLHGVSVEWHRNGHIASRVPYSNGRVRGLVAFHDKTGKRIASYVVAAALVKVTHLSLSGRRRSTGHYLAGRRHGEWVKWRDHGRRISLRQSYDRGRLQGRSIVWFRNGLWRKGCYDRGVLKLSVFAAGDGELYSRKPGRAKQLYQPQAGFCAGVQEPGPSLSIRLPQALLPP